MKKQIISFLFLVYLSFIVFDAYGQKTIEKVYYGTKSSSNGNNPCKGATTTICGRINITIDFISYDSEKGEALYTAKEILHRPNGILMTRVRDIITSNLAVCPPAKWVPELPPLNWSEKDLPVNKYDLREESVSSEEFTYK